MGSKRFVVTAHRDFLALESRWLSEKQVLGVYYTQDAKDFYSPDNGCFLLCLITCDQNWAWNSFMFMRRKKDHLY